MVNIKTSISYLRPYAPGGFWRSFGAILDLGNTTHSQEIIFGPNADYQSISSDWNITGNDISTAIDRFSKERL